MTIHSRITPEGQKYRVWHSFSDRYLTEPLAERTLLQLLLSEYSLKVSVGTLIEAETPIHLYSPLYSPERIEQGAIGRVEFWEPEDNSVFVFSVRWNQSLVTGHKASFRNGCLEILDARIRILGNVSEESPHAQIRRAKLFGTSSFRRKGDELNSDWERERCPKTDLFHHSFLAREDGTCRNCGEPSEDPSHSKEPISDG